MNSTNLLKIAIKSLGNNKFRGFLTMLGIIIGVASVITMLAIGEGSKKSIQKDISKMGSNMINISPENQTKGGVKQGASSMESLTLEDYQTILQEAQLIQYCSPTVSSNGQFIYGANNTPSKLTGITEEYLNIRQVTVEDGRCFSQLDVKRAAKVCLIGKTVADELFADGQDPIGKVIRFNKTPFTIIGLLESKGYNSMGMDQDDVVYAPYTTIQKRILAITHLQSIYVSTYNEAQTEKAITELTTILRKNHKLKAAEADDFRIRSQQELLSMITSTTDLLTILLASIASISLLVGGIGIMNIMYVSVTERTKEIGLRMSVGARGIDILIQFLIEAILISFTGGLIGVLLGLTCSYSVNIFMEWPIYIEPFSILLSFLVCSITGIFFGWYPAKKASQLDPIEAIRYE